MLPLHYHDPRYVYECIFQKISWFNMSFTQELVTTMLCGAAWQLPVYLRQIPIWGLIISQISFRARPEELTVCAGFACTANYGIWIIWGIQMVYRQYHYNLLTASEMPQWTIGIAIPCRPYVPLSVWYSMRSG